MYMKNENKIKKVWKFYRDKKYRKTCMDAKICVSNLKIFLQKKTILPPWIKNAQIFHSFAFLDNFLIKT